MKISFNGIKKTLRDEFTYKLVIVFLGILYWLYGLMPIANYLFSFISLICIIRIFAIYVKCKMDFTKIFPLLILCSGILTIIFNEFKLVDFFALGYILIEVCLLVHCDSKKSNDELTEEFRKISKLFVFLGTVIIVVSLYTYFAGIQDIFSYPSINDTTVFFLGKDPGTKALTGILCNANAAASFFVLYLGLLLFLLEKKGLKIVYILCMALDCIALFYTYSRGGYIGVIFLFLSYFILNVLSGKSSNFRKVVLIGLCLVFFGVCILLSFDSNILSILNVSNRDATEMTGSTKTRLLLWQAGYESFVFSVKNFLFGVGCRIRDSIALFVDSNLRAGLYNNMHNIYMQVLVSYGLIGFFCFFVYLLQLIARSLKLFFEVGKASKDLAPIISLCFAVLVINLVESEIYMNKAFNGTVFWICCGYLYSILKARKNKALCNSNESWLKK